MASSLCFAVFVVAVAVSVQMNLALASGSLSLSDCDDSQFKLNNDNRCRNCPACPAGQEYTHHCGYEEENGRINKTGKSCQDCPPNYYKASKSPFQCDSCTRKCPRGAKMIHPCNKTHDLKCKCEKGFFTAENGDCVRCSPCCGKPSVFTSDYLKKECEDAGMQTCSCRPIAGCSYKTGDCKKPLLKASTAKPSRKTSPSPTTISRKTHKCEKGFYTAPNGSCVQCSFCCGMRSAQRVQQECKDAGMGQCSCSSLQNCIDNSGTCTRSSTLPSTSATIITRSQKRKPTRSQKRKPSRKTSKRLKQNPVLSGTENSKQDCRNKAVLRQLRRLLAKYKKRVVIKISVEVKETRQRKGKRKGRDLSRRLTAQDDRRQF